MAEKLATAKTEEKAKELEEEAMKVELKTKEELKPWEQHSAVITIPRFDYNTSSSLLSHSHSGFLITCPIKREKSATKEAMSILEKYFGPLSGLNAEGFEILDANMSAKGMRISEYSSMEEELGSRMERKDAADDFGEPGFGFLIQEIEFKARFGGLQVTKNCWRKIVQSKILEGREEMKWDFPLKN